jgi:hypothetical protein
VESEPGGAFGLVLGQLTKVIVEPIGRATIETCPKTRAHRWPGSLRSPFFW